MGLEFGVLGPVWASEDGVRLAVPAGKQSLLLALLLARANRPVPGETIVETLWPGERLVSGRGGLHNRIMRLRRALGPRAAERVRTSGDGYLLEADEAELDHLRFVALRARAERALAAEDWSAARERLRDALDLWRGRAFEGLATEGRLADEADRLEELRWLTAENWVEAEQRLGGHERVVADLRALTRNHPLRERFHAQLMLSLHATGRTAEALDVYQRVRTALVEELGIEPGAVLRAAHEAVLTDCANPADADAVRADGPVGPDQGPEPAGNPRPADRPTLTVPYALPAGIADFTGREQQVGRLLALLPGSGAQGPNRAVVISSIGGMGGIGKTTLAVHVGHLIRGHFPAGQLFANLRGTTPEPLDPHDVLGGFLRQLGVPAESVPAETAERTALYRSLLADRRMLVLLDDALDEAQVEPLIPGGSGSLVLVTVRQSLAAPAGAVHLHLDVLDADSAFELFARIVGVSRVAAEPEATAQVLEVCAGLPLAIRLAGVRLATRPRWRVRDLAERLHSATRRLDGFDLGDQRLRATFEVGYRTLLPEDGAEPDPEDPDAAFVGELPPAARAFCLLGLWTGADLELSAACALLGLPPESAEPLLEQLVDANLVESPHPGRYGLHDLLRAYAAERAHVDLTAAQLEESVTRLVTWYTLAAAEAGGLLAPQRSAQAIDAVPALPPLPAPSSAAEAVSWSQREQANLVSAVHLAKSAGLWRLARQLPTALWTFLQLQRDRRTWVSTLEIALEAVRHEGTRAEQASVLNNLAIALIESDRATQAMAHLETTAAIRHELGDFDRAAMTLMNLGVAAAEAGEQERAIDSFQRALEIHRSAGNREQQALVHTNLGRLRMLIGDAEGALAEGLEAERLYRENPTADPRWGQAKENLSEAYLRLGDVAAARREIEDAVRIRTEFFDRRGLAGSLSQLGHVHRAEGELEAARKAWQEAAEIFEEFADPALAEVLALLQAHS